MSTKDDSSITLPNLPNLPRWVWDLVADILEHEDTHGISRLSQYLPDAAIEIENRNLLCLSGMLNRVPPQVRQAAAAIKVYRRDISTEGL